MRNKIVFACLLLMFGAGLLWAQSGEPSLAEVAKRKPQKRAAKVVTEDEMPASVSFEPTNSSEESKTRVTEDQTASGGDADNSKPQPAARSATGSSNSARLEQLKDQEAQQKKTMQDIKQQMDDETDDFRRNVRRQMLEDMQTKLDDTAKQRQQLEQKMADKKSGEKSSEQRPDDNPK